MPAIEVRRTACAPVIYAAYGSNLHLEQMLARCPDAMRVGTGVIRDHRLVFRRTADIEPHPDKVVQVGLFRLTRPDERTLDRYEGRPRVYRKVAVLVDTGETTVRAMAYVMRRRDEIAPEEGYARRIAEGYADWGLDRRPLVDALARHGIKLAELDERHGRFLGRAQSRSIRFEGAF